MPRAAACPDAWEISEIHLGWHTQASLSLVLSYTIGLRYLFLRTRQSFARYIGLYREFPNNTDSPAIAARNYPRRLIDRPIDDPALSRLADISGAVVSSSVDSLSLSLSLFLLR